MSAALVAQPPHPSRFFTGAASEPAASEPKAEKRSPKRLLPMGLALLRLPLARAAAQKPRLAGPPPPHVLSPYVGLRPVPPAPARLAA